MTPHQIIGAFAVLLLRYRYPKRPNAPTPRCPDAPPPRPPWPPNGECMRRDCSEGSAHSPVRASGSGSSSSRSVEWGRTAGGLPRKRAARLLFRRKGRTHVRTHAHGTSAPRTGCGPVWGHGPRPGEGRGRGRSKIEAEADEVETLALLREPACPPRSQHDTHTHTHSWGGGHGGAGGAAESSSTHGWGAAPGWCKGGGEDLYLWH